MVQTIQHKKSNRRWNKKKNINKRNETKHTKSNIQRKLNGKDM